MIDPTLVSRACSALPIDPSARLATYRALTRLIAPGAKHAHATLKKRRLFLVTSTGRTGTTWLATLLNRVDDCTAVHEPIPAEQCAHVDALERPESASEYLATFRSREIAWRLRSDHNRVYGEVNGALRRHVGAFKTLFPTARTVHIVRHPRSVLMSMLNRGAFSEQDRVYRQLQNPRGIEAGEWASMDQFSRLCWLWAADNAYLRQNATHLAVFEDITRDYESLRDQILNPLDLSLSESIWREHRARGRNESKSPTGNPRVFSAMQETQFKRYCSDELAHYACYADSE